MALSSPNLLGAIANIRAHIAYHFGKSAFSQFSTENQILANDFLELAIDEIAASGAWTWLKRKYRFTTLDSYTTGTVAVTNRNATVTGTGTTWVTGAPVTADRSHFILGTQSGGYRITAVALNTSLTIDPIYGGATASAQTYEIVNDDYLLGDGVWWMRSIREINSPAALAIRTEEEWVAETGGIFTVGRPTMAILLPSDTSGSGVTGTRFTIRLWPGPDNTYAYVVDYRSVPTFPANNFESHPQAQSLVIFKALQHLWAHRQEFTTAAYWEQQYAKALLLFRRMDTERNSSPALRLGARWSPGEEDGERIRVTEDIAGP